ncbi:MAG: T9SS type A sorting domain-containing protein [Bacteroidota bacterium]
MNLCYLFNISKKSAGKAKGWLWDGLEHSCICGLAFPFSSLFLCSKNYPNPVHNITTISFHIPQNGHVSIEIINVRGQVLDRLVNKQLNPGQHTITWDGRNYPSGLYFYNMRYKGFTTTKKLIISH